MVIYLALMGVSSFIHSFISFNWMNENEFPRVFQNASLNVRSTRRCRSTRMVSLLLRIWFRMFFVLSKYLILLWHNEHTSSLLTKAHWSLMLKKPKCFQTVAKAVGSRMLLPDQKRLPDRSSHVRNTSISTQACYRTHRSRYVFKCL